MTSRVVRGQEVRPTVADRATPCPADRVNRQCQAPRPNAPWIPDFSCVATWRVSRTAQAGFVLDALEQALHDRRPVQGGGLAHRR